MRKRMRKAFITVILLIGMFIGCVTPVFAGQVGQSFRFTLKNRTSISVTVEVTFEIFQDYVTTTPYSTTKKTYTVGPMGVCEGRWEKQHLGFSPTLQGGLFFTR